MSAEKRWGELYFWFDQQNVNIKKEVVTVTPDSNRSDQGSYAYDQGCWQLTQPNFGREPDKEQSHQGYANTPWEALHQPHHWYEVDQSTEVLTSIEVERYLLYKEGSGIPK